MAPTKKNVLITGCSDGGLGAALADALHKTNRYRVVATARTPSKMQSLIAQGIDTLPLDVLSSDSIANCVSATRELLGSEGQPAALHMVILNAGGGYGMPMMDTNIDEMREVFELNVFSQVAVMQAFFPFLRAAVDRDGPHSATLVLQTSVASVVSLPLGGVYAATKAAFASIADALRVELAPFGINVVDLKTGAVRTNFFSNTTGDAKLPAGSAYNVGKAGPLLEQKMDEFIEKKDMMDASVWANKVVSAIDSRHPPAQVWKGNSATLVWVGRTFFPHTFADGEFAKRGGMDVLTAEMQRLKAGKS